MNFSDIFAKSLDTVKRNSPEILTAFGVSGVIGTAYFAAKAGYQTARLLESEPPDLDLKEKIKVSWKLYIWTGLTGAMTIGAIVGSNRLTSRQTAAAITAYTITDRAFSEYKEKVVEQLGKNKEQAIRDEIRQKKIEENPPGDVIVIGGGDVLCCELHTGRYFKSDMETLQRAKNEINAKINSRLYVTLDEFYDAVGLPHTSQSNMMGWDSDKLMDFEITYVGSEDHKPCLAFDYNYLKPLS